MIKVQLPPESRDVEHLILEIKEKGVSVMGLQKNLEAIKLRGIEEGIERGIEKGIEKGIEQGIEKGIEKGRALERENVVRNLIALGLDNAAIEAATGVPEEKIEQCVNSFTDGFSTTTIKRAIVCRNDR
ncbi:hypothetical protein [Paenibacillus hamazuiensis]|uniref:hypothetical protein n=1 Tax=Paenibacillus hamazuiensis TaxID=2936508 RepID=UPI00200D9EB1|nr:hypothetical protein [Paenibacillus hamazuiensis]